MSKLLKIGISGMIIFGLVFGYYSITRADISTGLVLYYTLDDADISAPSVTDSSDETNTGTLVNAPTTGGAGKINQSVAFNGTDESVTAADHATLDVGDVFTYAFWVKRSSTTPLNPQGYDVFFSKGTDTAVLAIDVGGTNEIRLYKSGGGLIVQGTTGISDTTTWHHIALTKNGSTVKLYLDNVDITGSVSNETMASNTSTLRIAADCGGSCTAAAWLAGSLDDFRIYNRALSASDVAELYAYPPVVASGGGGGDVIFFE